MRITDKGRAWSYKQKRSYARRSLMDIKDRLDHLKKGPFFTDEDETNTLKHAMWNIQHLLFLWDLKNKP